MRNKLQISFFLILLIAGFQGKLSTASAQPTVDFSFWGVCAGGTTHFIVDETVTNTSDVTSYHWDFDDGNFSPLKNPANTYAGFGTYNVTLTITNTAGLTNSVTHQVVIHDLPTSNFYYDTPPNCSGDSIQFFDLSFPAGGLGYISRWIWNFGDGTPNDTTLFPDDPNIYHTFPNPGSFFVTLTVMTNDSCSNSFTRVVDVAPSPIANFFFNGQCKDQTVNFTDASQPNGPGSVLGWSWDFGDPGSGINNYSLNPNPSHIYATPGIYKVVLEATNYTGCTDTMTKYVTIHDQPAVAFNHNPACLNEPVTFTADAAIMNLAEITTWDWDFGDGVHAFSPLTASHTFITTGTYHVVLTVTDIRGCIGILEQDILINPLPVAFFDAGTNNCAGATVHFDGSGSYMPTAITGGYITRWFWDFGDGDTLSIFHPASPVVDKVYALANNYNVKLTVYGSDGCKGEFQQIVSIHPNPIANFISDTLCKGAPVQFTDYSQPNGGGSIQQYLWNFGDPASGMNNTSVLPNPQHTFTATGTFLVTLIVTSSNGCTDTLVKSALVKPQPPVDFSSTHNCQNNPVEFTPNTAVMNVSTIATWFWDFGDGNTLANVAAPTHNYSLPGPYTVILTVTDIGGCSNSIAKLITIVGQPTANFSASQPTCKDNLVTFSNLSFAGGGYIVKSEWNFGDNTAQTVTNLANVTHTYTNYGAFTVTLTVTTNDSCKNTINQVINVLPNPSALFSYSLHCAGTPVQFDDLSQQGSGSLAGWQWNFGDPASGGNNVSTLPEPTHVYNSPGTYQVTLTVTNSSGCTDQIVMPVIINALPTVDFSSSPGCVSDSTHFISSTFIDSDAIVSLIWNFGDNFTSPDPDPYHIYAASGTYLVTLTVTDTAGCVSYKQHTVSIALPPVSSFQVSSGACSGTAVSFTNLSSTSGGSFTSYYYDFNDGHDTTIYAPANGNVTHIYAVAGTYNVTLKVNTSLGCEAESQKTVVVATSPHALFTYENTCAGASVNFTDQSSVNSGTNITAWYWIFGDPISGVNNTSTLQNPLHIYGSAGNYIVTLQVTNSAGCVNTLADTLKINPKPAVEFDWLNTCLGTGTQFSLDTTIAEPSAIAGYDWNFGDGTAHNTTQQNPLHYYASAGQYNVVLTITDTAGCENAISHIVTIVPKPTALFTIASACLGASTHFNDQSFSPSGEPITGWHWDFGITAAINDTSNLQNPSWIYNSLGVYTVSLIVTAQSGCQDTTTMNVQVFDNPLANFTYTALPCDNGAVSFQDSSYSQQSVVVGWLWEFGPGQFSTLQNPVHVFYQADSCYDVRLIVTDVRGCVDTTNEAACVPADFDVTFTTTENCFNDTTLFTPVLLAPATDSLIFFNWSFGDPGSGIYNTSTERTPLHYYSTPGTYTAMLQATDINNCKKEEYLQVVIHPLPLPAFTISDSGCDSTIHFDESSSGNGSNIKYWKWDFGDGVTKTIYPPEQADTSYHYAELGLYTATLTVVNNNGCEAKVTNTNVLVKPCIQALLELADTLLCMNNTLTFNDTSECGIEIKHWKWDFDDGTVLNYDSYHSSVTHVFKASGTYNVKLTISTLVGGQTVSDSIQLPVLISPTPLPEFETGVVCHLQSANFQNMTSTGNGPKISSYSWQFGEPLPPAKDTSSLKNPSHLYKAPGTYNVKLVAENTIGCKDSIQKQVIVFALPEANYEYSLSCAGEKTAFTDISIPALAPIVKWDWTFNDDGGVLGRDDIPNPEFVFPNAGKYIVNLMVSDTNGCYDTTNIPVTTWSVPVSVFSYTDNFSDIQGFLSFVNTSIDAVKYYWTFGNGDDSYIDNPTEFYENDGTYQIQLITWNEKQCTDTLSVEYTLLVKGLFIPNAFSPSNPKESVRLLKPVGINLMEYRFEVFDRWGNMLWKTDKLDLAGRPVEGWDGTYNGKPMPEGVYTWRATGVFRDGTVWEAENLGNSDGLVKAKSGTATMIR